MKKRLFILFLLICLSLTGCTTDGFQISELKVEGDVLYSSLKGKIKNTTNKDCDSLILHVDLTSGTLKEKEKVYISDEIKSNETYNLDGLLLDVYEGYDAKITKIECKQED